MSSTYPKTVPHPFENDDQLRSAYRRGWNRGHGLACHNVPELGARFWVECLGRVTVDPNNIREIHESLCYEAESNSRQFSPFEFIAYEFNSADEEIGEGVTDALWEAFEAGIGDSINADLATYTDDDYGIEPEAPEADDDEADDSAS